MDATEITEIVCLLAVFAGIVVAATLFGRLRWLSRSGGAFECAVRCPGQSGFMQGVARYNGQYLEWFRAFSLSFSPRVRIQQSQWEVDTSTTSSPGDATALSGLDTVMTLRVRGAGDQVLAAMSPASAMGLRSWLESAPPGRGHYGLTAH